MSAVRPLPLMGRSVSAGMYHLTLAGADRTPIRRRTVKAKLNVKEQRVADTFPNLWATVLRLAGNDTSRIRVIRVSNVEVYPIPYIEWRRQYRGRQTHARR